MLEQRDLKKDLLALGLLALAAFLAAALLSYDAGDPPSQLVYPQRAEVLNVCGRSGAFVSRCLFSALGLGAYYLVFSLGVLDAMLLARRPLTQPIIRLCGWLISLAGLTTFVAMAMPQLSPGPVIGAGGYLGAAGRGLLEMNFATVGAYILTVSLILGGLLLSTDYLLVHIIAFVVGRPAQGIGQGMMQVGAAAAKRLRRRSDLDGYEPAEDAADGGTKILSVRVKGRPGDETKQGAADVPAAEPDKKADQPASAPPASEPAAAESSGGGLTSLLRIRKPKAAKKDEDLQLDEPQQNAADYELPSIELLLPSETFNFDEQENEVRRRAKILEQTFRDFGFNIRVVEIQTGPVIAQFEVELEAGLRLSKITGLADDLAIALRVPSVRIVAPIPGKNTVGIEVPNTTRQIVRLREVIEEANGKVQKMRIPVYLGKDVSGNPMTVDLSTLPHLLIAGRTGTGKSVCLNSIITSMVMTRRPDEVRMLMIDPKMVELSQYKSLPHLMHPVVTDMKKAEAILGLGGGEDGRTVSPAGPGGRAASQRLQPVGRRGTDGADSPGKRRGAPPDPHAHAVYRDRGRRACRPDDDLRQGGRDAHHPPGAEEPGGRHPPRAGHAEADGRRDHGADQVELAGTDLLPGGQPHRQPRGVGRNGGRQAAGQRRHALPLAGHEHAASRPGNLPERRRDQPRDCRRGHHASRSSSRSSCS